jgi:hypothetical protein
MQNYQSKAAIKSVGVVGPAVAFIVAGFGAAGVDISAEVAGVTEAVGHLIDNAIILIGAGAGVYGRVRAQAEITGFFKAK